MEIGDVKLEIRQWEDPTISNLPDFWLPKRKKQDYVSFNNLNDGLGLVDGSSTNRR